MKTDKESISSQEGAMANKSASSVCHICRGFGDEGSPRGKILRKYPYSWTGQSEYVYAHYPTLVLLSESAQKGCQICAMILHAIKEYDSDHCKCKFDGAWAEAEELEGAREDPFNVARDTFEVALLLDNERADDDYCAMNLNATSYGPGRIVLLFDCEGRKRSGLRKKTGAQNVQIRVLASEKLEAHSMFFVNTPVDPLDPGEPYKPPARDILSEPHLALVRRWLNVCASEHRGCRTHQAPAQKMHIRLLNRLGRSWTKTGAAEHEITGVPCVLARKLPTRVLEISSDPATGDITGVRIVEKGGSEGVYACLSYCWGRSSQESKTTKSNLRQYRNSIRLDNLPGTIIDALKLFCKLGFRYIWIDSLCIIQKDNEDWQKEASNMAAIYSNSALTLAIHLCADSAESFLPRRLKPKDRAAFNNAARLAYTDETTGQARFLHLFLDINQDIARFLQEGWGHGPGTSSVRRPRSSWLDRAWTFQEWLLSPRVLHIHEMTVWDCYESYGNEFEYRFLGSNYLQRAPVQLGRKRLWNEIVAEYTRRGIAKMEDRLPALAGLAERYGNVTGFRYLAGIWLEDLPYSLLWEKRYPGVEPPTGAFRAPSWSWAALEQEIDLSLCSRRYKSSRTSVVSAHCEYYPQGSLSTVKYGWLDIRGPICPVVGYNKINDENSSKIELITENVTDEHRWVARPDRDAISPKDIAQSQIYLLEVATKSTEAPLYYKAFALILKRTEQDGGKDTFRRLGLAHSYRKRQDRWEKRRDHWGKRIIRLV